MQTLRENILRIEASKSFAAAVQYQTEEKVSLTRSTKVITINKIE